MIVLDTNVISAMMERDDHPQVVSWIDQHEIEDFCTTTVNLHELWFGLDKLPRGRRRTALVKGFEDVLELLGDRILHLDAAGAKASGHLQAHRELKGRPIALGDCLMAGIALSRGARFATRNVRHFEGLGLEIINPWDIHG